jgi:hypothetical protein
MGHTANVSSVISRAFLLTATNPMYGVPLATTLHA